MKFLAALQLGHSITRSCEIACLPRRTAYYWRNEDSEFAEAWDEAVASSIETLEDLLRQRATDPNDPKSHILLIFLLKKLNPEYKENYKPVEAKKPITTQEFDFSSDEVDAAMAILQTAKNAASKTP